MDVVHVNFSSPSTAAAAYSGAAGGEIQILETAWTDRQWHPQQISRIGWIGLFCGSQRLKSVQLKQGTYPFTWSFANDGDADVTGSTPICVNRSIAEKGLTNRTWLSLALTGYTSLTRIDSVPLLLSGNKGKLYALTRWNQSAAYDGRPGLLPALKNNDLQISNGPATANINNVTDLSRLQWLGNPYHGVCNGLSVARPGYSSIIPRGTMTTVASGSTRYFKSPAAPGEPAADVLPANYASLGLQLLPDVVLMGGGAMSPVSGDVVAPNQWLHAGDDGVVRVLELAKTSGNNSSDIFEIRDCGSFGWGLAVTQPSKTVLATITVSTTDSFANSITADNSLTRRFTTGESDYQWDSNTPNSYLGVGFSPYHMTLNTTWRVEASPDGHSIAIVRGINVHHALFPASPAFYEDTGYAYDSSYPCVGVGGSGSLILTVATVSINGARTVGSVVDQFQWAKHKYFPDDLQATVKWKLEQTTYLGYPTPDPSHNWYFVYSTPATLAGTEYTRSECRGVTWKIDGSLKLWIVQSDMGIVGTVLDWYNALAGTYPTATPSTQPAPTPPYADGSTRAVVGFYADTGDAGRFNFYSKWGYKRTYTADLSGDFLQNLLTWRVSNNIMYAVGDPAAGGHIWKLVTPTSTANVGDYFSQGDANQVRFSYNPRTAELAASRTFNISWI